MTEKDGPEALDAIRYRLVEKYSPAISGNLLRILCLASLFRQLPGGLTRIPSVRVSLGSVGNRPGHRRCGLGSVSARPGHRRCR